MPTSDDGDEESLFWKCRRFFGRIGIGAPVPGDLDMDTVEKVVTKIGRRRRVCVASQIPNQPLHSQPIFPVNAVRTSKYTVLTFVPKNLAEQFRKIANLYFLLLVVLQGQAVFQVFNPVLAALPLMVIIAATALKDAIEDVRRQNADKFVNNSIALTLESPWNNVNLPQAPGTVYDHVQYWISPGDYGARTSAKATLAAAQKHAGDKRRPSKSASDQNPAPQGWRTTLWKDIFVGDIVYLKSDEPIPADVVVLSSSDSEGACYIETKNLDGESNLKLRRALRPTMNVTTAQECTTLNFYCDSEPPTLNLYSYTGLMVVPPKNSKWQPRRMSLDAQLSTQPQLTDIPADSTTEPINIDNILLRGSTLRNTEWVIGLVLFTGYETKVMLNGGKTPSKRSRIDRLMNVQILLNFAILIAICAIVAALNSRNVEAWISQSVPWISLDITVSGMTLFTFWASMIMFQNIVPISLYITMEIVKTIQAYFIYQDVDMYDPEIDQPCIPKNWTISDDAGQIEFLFSDKTGTLTQNKMEFRRCSIGGVIYGIPRAELSKDTSSTDGTAVSSPEIQALANTMRTQGARYIPEYAPPIPAFIDDKLYPDLMVDNSQSSLIKQFFTVLAICHTVPTPTGGNPPKYQAQSPDELALVKAACELGFIYKSKALDDVTIQVLGQMMRFKVLHVMEFTSARKRMSVIVRTPEGKIMIFCKGADNILLARLHESQHDQQRDTFVHLSEFANEGLRTLVIAHREMPLSEYEAWSKSYAEASSALVNRAEALEQVADIAERDFHLLGATAIEDRLQDGVPEAIELLRGAGIKVWVLTGDKMETAINIAFASNLFTRDQTLAVIRASANANDAGIQVAEALNLSLQKDNIGLVVEGDALRDVLAVKEFRAQFLELGVRCTSVVCCRASPKQKAQVVRLVKLGLAAICLAVGDGANDVSMIQEADVGVGIAGQEGLQAAMSSDYVIGQFRFLTKLLLVHGHWSYYRTSETILNFFYKNFTWTFTLFWFQIYCGFSSTILYDFTFIMLYNLVFTSLPPLVMGIFDQDCPPEYLMTSPQLYYQGLFMSLYTIRRFVLFTVEGIWHSIVCFFTAQLLFSTAFVDHRGHDEDLAILGTAVASYAIVVVNIYILMNVKHWTLITVVVLFLSMLSFFLWTAIYSQFISASIYRVDKVLFYEVQFWISLLCAVVACLLPSMIIRYLYTQVYPSDVDIVRELAKTGNNLEARFADEEAESPNTSVVQSTIAMVPSDAKASTLVSESPVVSTRPPLPPAISTSPARKASVPAAGSYATLSPPRITGHSPTSPSYHTLNRAKSPSTQISPSFKSPEEVDAAMRKTLRRRMDPGTRLGSATSQSVHLSIVNVLNGVSTPEGPTPRASTASRAYTQQQQQEAASASNITDTAGTIPEAPSPTSQIQLGGEGSRDMMMPNRSL
ncbi:hypothetical protein SmJEL517_g00757 [Synchytrium microbalum]|uniref:Phospholipid-transporting ATPase n=1 Tax=Synchytrium microbalum TaxID=1806994 RepID=A0A507CIQ3_9FUNG|nr:uncharacterized protein SmJEL517_g00757 [Synchytrium microbalum]TPX37615.1 hypothetical protein SmJEL517_g00757 [Synchytrium microbalum]